MLGGNRFESDALRFISIVSHAVVMICLRHLAAINNIHLALYSVRVRMPYEHEYETISSFSDEGKDLYDELKTLLLNFTTKAAKNSTARQVFQVDNLKA